jgi:O-acetylserine/cysteine efflux transporter
MRYVVGSALMMGVLHYSLMFTAMRMADEVATLAVVVQLFVPFSTVIAVIFLGERIGVWRIGGLVLAFGGVMVIAFDPGVINYVEAVGMVVVAALAAAISTVFVRSMRDVGVFNLQAWMAVIAVPGLFLVSWIFEIDQSEAFFSADALAWSSIAFSAIGASLVGHGIVYYLLRRYPVTVTMPYML